jgi:hypothetical protein
MTKRFTQLLDVIKSASCEMVTTELPPQLSVAVTVLSLAAGTALAQEYVASAGNPLIVGAFVAFTVIVWLLLAEFPHASVAT